MYDDLIIHCFAFRVFHVFTNFVISINFDLYRANTSNAICVFV